MTWGSDWSNPKFFGLTNPADLDAEPQWGETSYHGKRKYRPDLHPETQRATRPERAGPTWDEIAGTVSEPVEPPPAPVQARLT